MTTQAVVWIIDGDDLEGRARTETALAKQTIQPLKVVASIAEVSDDALIWCWILPAGYEPRPNALAELLAATENSGNIGQVGPMLLDSSNTRRINELGITLSPFGAPIELVSGQLDQSQHFEVKDVLAVSWFGSIIRGDVLRNVGEPSRRNPGIAKDLDQSIRIRRHDFRVVVAPNAKVLAPESRRLDNRRAALQIRYSHASFLIALLYWLGLPIVTTFRVAIRLAQKRPGLIWSELVAGLWGFLTMPIRFSLRRGGYSRKLRDFKDLRATWQQTISSQRAEADAQESDQNLAAFQRGDHENESIKSKTLGEAGGVWFAIFLLALSWQQLPQSQAVTGGSWIPVSNDWFTLFARAGASWQPIGQGFVGPSDPFNWDLLLIGSFTFWSTNLAFVVLFFVAKALAFLTAWKAISLLTSKAWQRNLGALIYALLPAFGAAISNGEIAAVVVTILLPWLVFSIARAAGLGRSGSARSDARTWSWVGLSGLLLALVAAASPTVGILALVALAVVAFTRLRRFGYLFWIPLPMAAIFLPEVWYLVARLGEPLAVLANPTIGFGQTQSDVVGSLVDLANYWHWPLGLLLLVALFALFGQRWILASVLTLFAAISALVSSFTSSLAFPADLISAGAGKLTSGNTGRDLAAVIGLIVIALVAQFAGSLKVKLSRSLTWLALVTMLVSLTIATALTPTNLHPSDGAVTPLLLQKQAEQGTDLQMLRISKVGDELQVQWLPIAGLHLEDSNLAYRFSSAKLAKDEQYQTLAKVVGDLAAANGNADLNALTQNKIGYILVDSGAENATLVAALESSSGLEGAGLTPFGVLWRISGISASDLPETDHSPWSVTKLSQLIALVGFGLLAVPTRPRRRSAEGSEIFIDQSESDLNV